MTVFLEDSEKEKFKVVLESDHEEDINNFLDLINQNRVIPDFKPDDTFTEEMLLLENNFGKTIGKIYHYASKKNQKALGGMFLLEMFEIIEFYLLNYSVSTFCLSQATSWEFLQPEEIDQKLLTSKCHYYQSILSIADKYLPDYKMIQKMAYLCEEWSQKVSNND